MTLPGINRMTAENVVAYRRQIGGFRKIEDLALVPGVGATRFGHVRAEICVSEIASSVIRSSLVRSGSSATSSGIDVSVTPADNVSRDFSGGCVALGGPVSMRGSASCACPLSTMSAMDDVDDRVSGTGRSLFDEALDDSTLGLLRRSVTRKAPLLTTDSGYKEQECAMSLRVATWHMTSCSREKADNIGVREVFALTLLENR